MLKFKPKTLTQARMSAASFLNQWIWPMNQTKCRAKQDKASLMIFWNLQGATDGSKNHETTLVESHSIMKAADPDHLDTVATRKPFLIVRISTWMVESASTYLAKWIRNEPWWSLKTPPILLAPVEEKKELSIFVLITFCVGGNQETLERVGTLWDNITTSVGHL